MNVLGAGVSFSIAAWGFRATVAAVWVGFRRCGSGARRGGVGSRAGWAVSADDPLPDGARLDDVSITRSPS
ncbi:hypothetical protein BH20CHL4_BH20CHL4_05600 [soil metagenome]